MRLILKRGAKNFLLRTIAFLNCHPHLRAMVRSAIHHIGLGGPARRVSSRLNNANYSRNAVWERGMPCNASQLSPRARQIYHDLKADIENKRKGAT